MTTETERMRLVTLLVLGALGAPAGLAAQSGAFIVHLGSDTVFVERYSRTAERLEGDQVSRTARQTTLRHFTAVFDVHGLMTSFELVGRPAASPSAAPQRARVTFVADTAIVEVTIGDSTRSARVRVPIGTIPYVMFSYALVEVLTQAAQRVGGPTFSLDMLPLGATAPFTASLTRVGSDSVAIVLDQGSPVQVKVDQTGRVLGATGRGTTEQVIVERVPSVDIEAVAAAFAARPLGQLSPRDSVRASVAGAQIMIDYGRPQRRGRVIFGDLVPWNQVWRTGANAATGFRTSADLVIGGTTIPAGAYTLWTLPSASGWKLIINKQTGQWGTRYDAAQDLVRLDMKVEQLPQPVEQFTITVEPRGSGGGAVLKLEWENTRAWVELTKR